MLDKLLKLAEVDSSEKRQELTSGIAKLFISNKDKISDQENCLFGEILTKLLPTMDESDKVDISNEFADAHNAPVGFVMALAKETADVATPVLTKSKVFNDENLIEISENLTLDHRLAISSREHVSSEVTDSLIGFGENIVLRSISVNEGAEISDGGLRKMLEYSKNDELLLSSMVKRDNLFGRLKSVVKTMAKSAQMQLSQHLTNEVDGAGADQVQAKTDLKHIADGTLDKDDVIMEFANKDKPLKIATLLASFSEYDEKKIANNMLQFNPTMLVTICKSADIGIAAVREIGDMRCRILKTPSSSVEKFVKDFMDLG